LAAYLSDTTGRLAFGTHPVHVVVVVLLALLVLSTTGCTTETPYEPVGEQLDTPEVVGTNAYVGYSERAGGVVVVVDGRVLLLRPGEQADELELYAENNEEAPRRAVWVPFVVDTEDGYSVRYFARPGLSVHEWAPEDDQVLSESQAVESFQTAVKEGQPLIPIMFPEQYYRFQDGAGWFKLTVTATAGEETTYRYSFGITSLAEEPASTLGAPGFDVLDLGDHRTLWLYRDWKLHESIGEWVNTCADDLEQFFGLEAHLVPLHVVIGPPGLYGPRVGNAAGYAFPEYSAATVASYHPNPQCVEDPGSSYLCSLVRHEVTHIVHSWALLHEGHSFFDASWLMSEGLATALQSPYDHQLWLRDLVATHNVTPFDLDMDSLLYPKTNPNYALAGAMVGYLVANFDTRVVAEYATVADPTARYAAEDELMQEYFGLSRRGLLQATLSSYEAPPGAAPDYVIIDWEVLGGPELVTTGFTVNPEGTKAATLYNHGTEIRLLDLNTGELTTMLSGQPDLGLLGPISWFPGGERIVFAAKPEGIANIYLMDIDDPDTVKPLVESNAQDSGPDVGPGGKHLAFRSERTGQSELYLLDLDTGQIEQLTSEERFLVWPSWSPDGSRLALVDAERNRVGVLDLAMRDVEWLDAAPYTIHIVSRPRWTSDETLVVNVRDTGYRVVALSFNLAANTRSTWGAADIWPSFSYFDVISGSFPPSFLVRTTVYDNERNTFYAGLVKVEFTESK